MQFLFIKSSFWPTGRKLHKIKKLNNIKSLLKFGVKKYPIWSMTSFTSLYLFSMEWYYNLGLEKKNPSKKILNKSRKYGLKYSFFFSI